MIADKVGLDHQDTALLGELLDVWRSKRLVNADKTIYFEGVNALKDFGFAIPPKFHMAETALGWVGKGVRALTNRSEFQGFVAPDEADDPFGLESILAENEFGYEFDLAKESSAVHGCSFLTVSQGDVAAGEPEVLLLARSADWSAGLWDSRRRKIRGFLSIVDVDNSGQPSSMIMYTPEKVISLAHSNQRWVIDVRANPVGEVTVARIPHQPSLKQPFGHSRITRAAKSHVDSALRTILRSEAQAELYAGPEYWLFNADMSAFEGDKWKALMGRIKGLETDPETEETPSVQRFEGASPQAHIDHLMMWGKLFASEMNLSLNSLGIVQDNPSSAEAMYAAKEDLITDARNANKHWGRGAVRAGQFAVMLRDGVGMSDGLQKLSGAWTDPALTSAGAKADAFTKRASVIPGYAETEVGLEDAGLSRTDIVRFKAERQRALLRESVSALAAVAKPAVEPNGVAHGDLV